MVSIECIVAISRVLCDLKHGESIVDQSQGNKDCPHQRGFDVIATLSSASSIRITDINKRLQCCELIENQKKKTGWVFDRLLIEYLASVIRSMGTLCTIKINSYLRTRKPASYYPSMLIASHTRFNTVATNTLLRPHTTASVQSQSLTAIACLLPAMAFPTCKQSNLQLNDCILSSIELYV